MPSEVRVGQTWRRKSDGALMGVIENPTEFGDYYSRIEIHHARLYVVRERIPNRYRLVEVPDAE